MVVKLKVALIAHDAKKKEILEWCKHNEIFLSEMELCATGTTGKLISENTKLHIKKYASGPLGGDQQIGSLIVDGKIDMLIFFWDPLSSQPHDVDVKALLRLAVLNNVLIACNRKTADYLITSNLHKI